MLLDKDSVLKVLSDAIDAINALPDSSPVGEVVPKADLDAAQAALAVDESKIEKAKEDLA